MKLKEIRWRHGERENRYEPLILDPILRDLSKKMFCFIEVTNLPYPSFIAQMELEI